MPRNGRLQRCGLHHGFLQDRRSLSSGAAQAPGHGTRSLRPSVVSPAAWRCEASPSPPARPRDAGRRAARVPSRRRHSVPHSMRSLNQPRWPMRNTRPASLPSPCRATGRSASSIALAEARRRRAPRASRPPSAIRCIRPGCGRGSRDPRRARRGAWPPHAASWRANTSASPSSQQHRERFVQAVEQVGRRRRTESSRCRFIASVSSQRQYERGSRASSLAASALSLTALNDSRRQHQPFLRAGRPSRRRPTRRGGSRSTRARRSCRPSAAPDARCGRSPARISAMRDVTPVDVSLWTTQHRLDRVRAVVGQPRLDRALRSMPPCRQSPGDETRRRAPSRFGHRAARASRSGRFRTSARDRPATAC